MSETATPKNETGSREAESVERSREDLLETIGKMLEEAAETEEERKLVAVQRAWFDMAKERTRRFIDKFYTRRDEVSFSEMLCHWRSQNLPAGDYTSFHLDLDAIRGKTTASISLLHQARRTQADDDLAEKAGVHLESDIEVSEGLQERVLRALGALLLGTSLAEAVTGLEVRAVIQSSSGSGTTPGEASYDRRYKKITGMPTNINGLTLDVFTEEGRRRIIGVLSEQRFSEMFEPKK